MADIHGTAYWPGALAVEACTYTISHGISPGIAILRMSPNPGDAPPAEVGNLIFEDGQNRIIIPDCKVNAVKSVTGSDGTFWSLEIVDRRWKWRDLGGISGCFNQLDPSGKLIPWMIRSPKEMAELCLRAMGETKFEIDLPDGLTQKDGEKFVRQLRAGENFPPSGTNPPINWEAEPPAKALQALVELFGRRVIYKLSTNSVVIAIPGRGKDLPEGSVARRQPGINAPERPSGVGVLGSPTRFQVRLLLEPVGLDWDGSYRPIDELSYAPLNGGAKQITTVTINSFSTSVASYKVYVDDVVNAHYTDPADTVAVVIASLAAKINANGAINGKVFATAASNVLTITAKRVNDPFAVHTDYVAPPTQMVVAMTQAAVPTKGWENSVPPSFGGLQNADGSYPVGSIRATDRLTIQDARALAQKSVWRSYRIADVDVGTGKAPIFIPGYGGLERRQQIVLQDTQVEQITPQPNDPNLKDRSGQPFTVNLYNGYSRDKPAAIYGSAVLDSAYALYGPTYLSNTPEGLQYFASFSIDPLEQLVVFSNHVYYYKNGQFLKPTLALQTGVLIRDRNTNQFECFLKVKRLENAAGITNVLLKRYPDIQLNYVSAYDEKNKLVSTSILEKDAEMRARHYLDGMLKQFPISNSMTKELNGIIPIDLDGAIQQVTWEVGESGCYTVASRDSEHSIWVQPYPARRRAEGLPSVPVQRIAAAVALATDLVIGGRQ